MNAIIAFDFTLAVVALFLIAYGVLRLSARTVVPVHPAAAKSAVFRRDIAYINAGRSGAGTALRQAYQLGYIVTARNGDWITLKRNGA